MRLQNTADDVGADLQSFCKFMGPTSLKTIPQSRFDEAMDALHRKKKAAEICRQSQSQAELAEMRNSDPRNAAIRFARSMSASTKAMATRKARTGTAYPYGGSGARACNRIF